MFGLEPGRFRGTRDHFHELIHEDDQEHAAAEVDAAIREQRSFQYEFRFYHADGSIRWMEGRGRRFMPMTDACQALRRWHRHHREKGRGAADAAFWQI